jgi:hypothetical protein
MATENTPEKEALESGYNHGFNYYPNAATFDVPVEYKVGPLAVQFALGYKQGFNDASKLPIIATSRLSAMFPGSKSENVGVQYRAPKA